MHCGVQNSLVQASHLVSTGHVTVIRIPSVRLVSIVSEKYVNIIMYTLRGGITIQTFQSVSSLQQLVNTSLYVYVKYCFHEGTQSGVDIYGHLLQLEHSPGSRLVLFYNVCS